ncbi:MAG: hypothetical protein H5T74_11755 [Actinobacteria bacterium]|nr:hypothetical protein [Actinomycetota bacterium]
MESFKKGMALLAAVTLLLLSLLSGLISATSSESEGIDSESAPSGMYVQEDTGSGDGVLQADCGESGGGEEALDPTGPEAGPEEDLGSGKAEADSPDTMEGKDAGGMGADAASGTESEGGKVGAGSEAGPAGPPGGLPGAGGGLLAAPASEAVDGAAGTAGGLPTPGVSALIDYTSVQPEVVDPWQSGNAQAECERAGCACPYAYKIDGWGQGMDGTYATGEGNAITIYGSDGSAFYWSSVWPVCCVIVKGGTGANIFRYGSGGSYGDGALYAPFRPPGSPGDPTHGISHVTFCFGPPENGLGSICGTKWEDRDCDGRHDWGEPPVSGVTIELYDSEGGLVATTVTGEDGTYCFPRLALGSYTVVERPGEGWYAKNPSDGSQDVVLSCLRPRACGVDFINARLGRIYGFKFFDRDCDGRWDGNEPGLEGVVIELWKDGELKTSVSTDERGGYAFEELKPGRYTVKEIVEKGWYHTTPNPIWVWLKCGEEERVDFGNTRLGTIHGYKFLDADCDGVMDEGEEGIPGVRVELRSLCGVREAWTDESGHYSFEGLWPGPYKVVLDTDTVPEGHYHTTGTRKLLWLCCCETEKVDFGNARYLSISGAKLDCHGEPVPGVLIELRQGDKLLASATTDDSGEYSFGSLLPGNYTVREVLTEEQLAEWYALYPEGGVFPDLQLVCGQDINDLDFINARYGSICGAKWEDLDGDGKHDEGEPPVEGVSIQLWSRAEASSEAVTAQEPENDGWTLREETATAEDGSYCFRGLKPGIYRVVEVLGEEQLEEWFTVAPEGGVHDGVELVCGESIEGLDFLNARYGSIIGYKYEDLDADGTLDEGEPGFAAVAIVLKRGDDVVATTTTGEGGRFSFAHVEPGTYDIEEILDAYVYTKASTTITGVVVVSGQETVLEEDYFLNYRRGSITGYKYLDADADGSLGESDRPWDGSANPVVIELVRDGTMVGTFTIRSDDGMYFFRDLEPGSYTVREAQPFPERMKSKAPTSVTVTVTSGVDIILGTEDYFLNYLEPEVAPEVITPPVAPQVQPELTGQLPATGADHLPLFLVSGMLTLLGILALGLGILRMRRT